MKDDSGWTVAMAETIKGLGSLSSSQALLLFKLDTPSSDLIFQDFR